VYAGAASVHRGHIPHSRWSKNLIYPKRQNVDLGCESEIARSADTYMLEIITSARGWEYLSWGSGDVQEHLHYANIIICVSEIY
jgi:hypothetical protein